MSDDNLEPVTGAVSSAEVRLEVVDPTGDPAQYAMKQYFAELDRRFPGGFDPELGDGKVEASELSEPSGVFLVLFAGDVVVGCGGLCELEPGVGEIKRMWVAESRRGQGLGGRMLRSLEDEAQSREFTIIRLDTNGELNTAISMYGKAGYHRIEPYNNNPFAELWFEKHL